MGHEMAAHERGPMARPWRPAPRVSPRAGSAQRGVGVALGFPTAGGYLPPPPITLPSPLAHSSLSPIPLLSGLAPTFGAVPTS
jgi:hypothetical protein